jgi:uncharacterized protein
MAEAKTEQDPSIEEILESIRQIISDDGDAPEKAAEPQAKPAEPKIPSDTKVLAPGAEAEDKPVAAKPAPAPAAADSKILDLTEKVDDTRVDMSYDPDPPPMIDLQEAPEMPIPQDDDISFLSEETADAAASEMSKLLSSNVAVEREVTGRVGRVTLEDIARDLMRPLLKTWMDENLPRVIEKAVAKELEKLSRRARDDD